MKNDSTEELKKEDLIQELMELVFEKVKEDSKETNAYGISKYLNQELDNKINERTLTRYYDGYIQSGDRSTPNDYSLDMLSLYLGYKNFKDFEVRRIYEKTIRALKDSYEEKIDTFKKEISKMKSVGVSCIFILLIVAGAFISKYYKKNCMIWVDDHYEKIRCSGLNMEESLDKVRLKKFKKVEVCNDSVFFRDGKPIKHYLRSNNKIEFFTYSGKHPVYAGKYVNEVTPTIVNNYVKPCDSI